MWPAFSATQNTDTSHGKSSCCPRRKRLCERRPARSDRAVPECDQFDIVFVAQLLRGRRLVADQTQSRNATALLIDGDDGLDFAQVAQIVDELPELRGAFDISAEKNERARLHFAEKPGRRRLEFLSRHTRHDQLTE